MTRFWYCLAFALTLSLVGHDASAVTRSTVTFTPVGSPVEIPATLIKPDGEGPFPAVVIMHDCSGLGTRSSGAPTRWAAELVAQGYVILIPDSFTPRGFADGVCILPGNQSASANGYVRAGDAYAALAVLRALTYVDAEHIGILGGSHGGWTTLAVMNEPISNDPLAAAKRKGFSAAIALYPSCANRYGTWSTVRRIESSGPIFTYNGVYKPLAPLLILIGEKDDWTPAEPCRKLVETGRAAGYPLDIKVYSGAYHSFDNNAPVRYDARRNNGNSPSGRGATTGGDPAAWADAKKQVAEFLSVHLKQQQ
jgi:dienelactone hydrolase